MSRGRALEVFALEALEGCFVWWVSVLVVVIKYFFWGLPEGDDVRCASEGEWDLR